MTDLRKLFWGLVWATLCFWGSPVIAQQQDAQMPKPAAHGYAPLVDTADLTGTEQQNTDAIQPDSFPVSGIQNLTLGRPPVRHSYVVPGIQYGNAYSSGSSGSASTGPKPGWNSMSFVSGNVSLLQEWSHSALSTNYSGGGYFSTDKGQGNGQYQQLATTYEIDGKRWRALLIDQFSLLPESSFGFGGTTGLSTPGVGGILSAPQVGLQSNYLPNQSIFAGTGSRYSNSAAVQFSYQVSTRGTVTVGGAYGILRFANSGGTSNDSDIFNAGYDYMLTARNTIGLSYGFSAYRFPGGPQAIGDQMAHVVFGRKITGRMALRLGGGPEITTFRIPIGGVRQKISGSGTASLSYAFAHSDMIVDYTHAVSGGWGVFNGANTDQVGVSLTKQLSRVWSGHVNVGYAKNRQLAGTTPSTNSDSWFTGAGLSRPLTRATNLSLGYQSQIQYGSGPVCSVSCATTYTSHQIILSLQWHMLPFVLR
jgi:hypothetical protein